MASKAAGVSDATLINLIYRHLKENGHKKAANVLKKHAPQVKTAGGKVSLSDVFKKWMSNDGANSQMTCVGERHPNGNSVPKPKKSKKVSCSPDSKKEKSQVTGAVKKRKKTKKADATSLGDFSIVGLSDLASISQKTGEDSDSDSSLDVEKWKRLALDFSDADIAKMDALTSVETTAAPTVKTPANKGKPAQIKKGRSPNVKLKPSATKKKDTVSDKLSKTKKLSKPGDKKSAAVLEQTPKKKKHTAKHSESDEAEATGTEVANALPEAVVAPQTHASNSSSATAKKVKHKKPNLDSVLSKLEALSENALEPLTITPLPVCPMSFIPEQADTMMYNGNLTVDQTMRYDALSDPGIPSAKKSTSKKSSKHEERAVLNATQLETEATVKQTKDQLKTPSKSAGAKESDDINPTEVKTPKKHKAKKYVESVEPVEVVTPSSGDQTEAFRCLSTADQSETPSKKNAKKAKSVVDIDPVETSSKKRKAKKTDLNGNETPAEETEDHLKMPSKKTKHHAANSLSETFILETPKTPKLKKVTETDQIEASSKKVGVDVEVGMATESLPFETDNTKISTKKRKKKSETVDDHVVASQIESCQQGVNSAVDNENDLLTDPALEGTWLSSPRHEKRKKRRSEGEEDMHVSALEDDAQEPRKRKKHKDKEKKKEIDSAESVVPTPPPEELLENKEKKKKKKKTSNDEEKPAVPTADAEAVVPKKKKKSKEKEQVTV